MRNHLLAFLLAAPALPAQQPEPPPAVLAAMQRLEAEATRAAAMAELGAQAADALPFVYRAWRQQEVAVLQRPALTAALGDAWRQLYDRAHAIDGAQTPQQTLVVDNGKKKRLVTLDRDGGIAELPLGYAVTDLEALPDGGLLVIATAMATKPQLPPHITTWGKVKFLGRDGAAQRTFADLRDAHDVDLLANGNLLIADTDQGRVIEVDARDAIVWTCTACAHPAQCERTDAGTWIADAEQPTLLRVDAAGVVQATIDLSDKLPPAKGGVGIRDLRALPDGNLLVCRGKRLLEVKADGSVPWQLDVTSGSIRSAQRLPGDFTLLAEVDAVREYDRAGRLVAEWPFEQPARALRR